MKDRELQGLSSLGAEGRVGAGVDRLGQPRPDVRLSACVRGLRRIDREARRDGREKGRGLADLGAVRALPPDPGLLHDVFRIRHRAKHAIADAEDAATVLVEDGERARDLVVARVIRGRSHPETDSHRRAQRRPATDDARSAP